MHSWSGRVFLLPDRLYKVRQMSNGNKLLEMKNITKVFPGVRALDNVSFDLNPGEVHVLLGENGAGKSTLMKVLAGAYVPDGGELYVCGEKVTKFSPIHAQNLGIGIIYQELNLVPYLDVAENIFIDHMPHRKGGIWLNHRKMYEDAEKLLQRLDMNVDVHAYASSITVAQQQMVEVAKALTHNLKILIMDEPTSSLSDREIQQLFKTIRGLTEKGIGVIYISHRLQEIPQIGDRITIIRDGQYIATENAADMSTDRLIKMMVGREIGNLYVRDYNEPGEVALEVDSLSSNKTGLKNVSMKVRRGEIVGLSGLVGAGRTELVRAVFGMDPYETGTVKVFGEVVRKGSLPSHLIGKKVGLLPEDRKRQGLSLILPVSDNIMMASYEKLFPKKLISRKREEEVTKQYIDELNIATPSVQQLVQNLSGGNQQKVVLAKWICTESEIFIFDEPTRGIDVGAKGEIYEFLNNLAKSGKAVIMISSELPEIIGMSDRIYVMRDRKIVKELDRSEATQERIMEYAMAGVHDEEYEK